MRRVRRSRGSGRTPWRLALILGVLAASACGDAAPELTLLIEAPTSSEMLTGDFLELLVTASGSVAAITWSSSDERVAVVVNGFVEARRPGPVTITAAAAGATSGTVDLTVAERPGGYTADEVDYFTEIAFGAEFGTSEDRLRRWQLGSGPLMRVNGSPSPNDRAVLDDVIAEINAIAPLDIEIVTDDFNTVEMHFVPQSEFQDILEQAPPGNNGIVWVWWDGTDHLFQSVVLIATDISEALRAHIIREEVTQMLGLLQDSFLYPESIFYQQFSNVTEYLPIDRVVIDLLHRPELTTGMTTEEAAQMARTLMRSTLPQAVAESGSDLDRSTRAPAWWWAAVDRDRVDGPRSPGSAGGS